MFPLQVSYLIVDEAMSELEMLNDPFFGNTENDIPYSPDWEDSGCLGNIKSTIKNPILLIYFYRKISSLFTEKMCCCSRKQHNSGSATPPQSRRKSIRCQSARSGLRNLTKSSRCQTSKSVNREPLEISVINVDP